MSFNEDKRIEACLASMEDVVDELVVVDSHSTDKTVEIARRFTDRVISRPFPGHVEQRAFSVAQATHDWVLILDCDEELSPELRESIREEKGRLGRAPAYRMSRRNFYMGRWLRHCLYPDPKIRLIDRRVARIDGRAPHDTVDIDRSRTRWLEGDILHYSFETISDHLQSIEFLTEYGARELEQRGVRVRVSDPMLHGAATLAKQYLLKRGFLDGVPGLVASTLTAVGVFTRYAKALELQRVGMSGAKPPSE